MGGHVIELPFEREKRLREEEVKQMQEQLNEQKEQTKMAERLSAVKSALKMLADKLPHELVAKYSSLTLEEVEKLAAGQTI